MADKKIGSAWNNYGMLAVEGNSTAETTTDATPRKIANFGVEKDNGVATAAHATDGITVADAGDYYITAFCSFAGTLSKTFHVEIYKDTTGTGVALTRKLGTGGDVGSAGCAGIVALTAGQVVSLYHASTDGGSAFTMVDGQLNIMRLK